MAEQLSDQVFVSLESFGYKYGLPDEADVVLGRPLPAQPALGGGAEALHRAGSRRSRTMCWAGPKRGSFLDQVVVSAAS